MQRRERMEQEAEDGGLKLGRLRKEFKEKYRDRRKASFTAAETREFVFDLAIALGLWTEPE